MMWNTLRLAIAAAIITLGLAADSTPPSGTSNNAFEGCLSGTCTPVDIFVYSFNPSLGTLDSVDWSLSSDQQVLIDLDNCSENGLPPLISYSYSITTGDSFFGSSTTYTGTDSGTSYGGCAGGNDFGYTARLQMQGVITTDLSQFIGTGTNGPFVAVTPFVVSGTIDTTPFPIDGDAFFIGEESDTLNVVYNYTPFSSVPEPRFTALIVIGVLGGMASLLKRRSVSSATKGAK